jgi:hypothetical protein
MGFLLTKGSGKIPYILEVTGSVKLWQANTEHVPLFREDSSFGILSKERSVAKPECDKL